MGAAAGGVADAAGCWLPLSFGLGRLLLQPELELLGQMELGLGEPLFPQALFRLGVPFPGVLMFPGLVPFVELLLGPLPLAGAAASVAEGSRGVIS